MKQNALSIDFKNAHVNGNEYSFDYNIMASITTATEITIQSFMGKSSIPTYFDRVNNRLYPISIDGYFTVGRYSLTFNATVSMDERVSAIESYLSSAVVYRTASGNPAVFSDGTAIDLKALSVTLVPVQSGSGEPSPDNVRPISGVSSVTVTRTGTGGANSQSVTVSLVDSNNNPLTVYCGTLDVTTGTLTVTWKKITFNGSETWYKSLNNNEYAAFYTAAQSGVRPHDGELYVPADILCSCYPVSYVTALYRGYVDKMIAQNNTAFWLRDTNYANMTAAEFAQHLTGDPIEIVCQLDAPVTYNLTPQQLAALAGYNSVTTNGDSVYLEYLSSGPPWSS